MTDFYEVLFEEMRGNGGNLGVMTLNRPSALNSLTHKMIVAMHARLKIWAADTNIKAVIIRAVEGRAFCAGGDLKLTYERACRKDPAMMEFFNDEYQLNCYIHHYPKPYIAILNGITMGGGVGVSIHGSHRIATDKLLFAMPETGIGFFPDVGGTYFLPRLPGKLGYYLGLTGARIKSDDCVGLGIAQHKVAEEDLTELLSAIANQEFTADAKASVTQAIKQFELAAQPSALLAQQDVIEKIFHQNTMEDILQNLHDSKETICQDALTALTKKSPTSLKVTLRALDQGQHLDFDTVMQHEYRLTCRFLQEHDFIEGIRAVIIDKDQKPQWEPAALVEVTREQVESYF